MEDTSQMKADSPTQLLLCFKIHSHKLL